MLNIPKMIMVGGNSRNSGKTSVACSIISKLSATHEVIGLKVTSIRPSENEMHGNHLEEIKPGYTIFEEHNYDSDKDTSKMLRAGATHVYFIRVEDTFAEQAILHFFSSYINNEFIVCESRSLRNIIEPGLFLMMVRNPVSGRLKEVADYLDKADFIFDFNRHQYEIEQFENNLYFDESKFSFVNTKTT